MQPIEDAETISDIAFGFMGSKALFAAIHLRVFDAIAEGHDTAEKLSGQLNVDRRGLDTLLTALVSLGLLSKSGNILGNAPGSQDYLVRASRGYFGDYLRLQIDRQMYPFMQNIVPALRGDYGEIENASYEDWMADPEEAELFSRSQHGGSLGPGRVLARKVDFDGVRAVLDVGGGTGAFSIMMCKEHPDLRATVMDFENVIELGRGYVAEAGLSDRIAFMPGNALAADWPFGQDAVLMSYLWGAVSSDALPELAERARIVLNDGGKVIVHDFMVEDDRTGPKMAALWALQHMVFSQGAVSLTPSAVVDVLSNAGFVDIAEEVLIPGMTRVVTARKAS